MPHVVVKLWPGKSEQQKTRLAEAITKDVMDILHYGEESVSVAMEEVKSQDWVETVYKPGITANWDKLTRTPDMTRPTCELVANCKGMEGTEMKVLAVILISLYLFAPVASQAQTSPAKAPTYSSIKIERSDSLQPKKGSAEYFTGSVQVQELFPAYDPSRTSGGKVTFEPGARSAWHTHPFGQILIVTDGTGWIQRWGGPIEEIRKGDVIWIPAGVKHWHGATPSTSMTHFAIQEQLNGKAVEWMEKVTDEQYRK